MLSPDGKCKTFDHGANGYVRSEGCAAIVLKRLPDALRDGDSIAAVIRGSAINHDGRSGGLTAPSSQAQAALLRKAYERAGISLDSVGMIEAHGTGTSLGDPIEIEALGEVFRGRDPRLAKIYVGSVKTAIGHTEAASGMAGLLKAVLSLKHKAITPHLHLAHKSSYMAWDTLPFKIATGNAAWGLEPNQERRVAGVSSFGFSGSNAHVVLEEFQQPDFTHTLPDKPHLVVVSARSAEALTSIQTALRDRIHNANDYSLGDLCGTLAQGRTHYLHRKAWVVESRDELLELLDNPLGAASLSTPADADKDMPDGYTPSGSLTFLFTGQGSEHAGMGLDLLRHNQVFREAIKRLDCAVDGCLDRNIAAIWANESGELNQATYLQPALFAYGWALNELWRSFGVTPAAVLGHSLGEYVAATVAGVMTAEEAIRLVAARGRLTDQRADPGSMLLVALGGIEARRLIAESPFSTELSIAAINSPSSVVVSGTPQAMTVFQSQLLERVVRHKPLRTTHAFHSATLNPMSDAFEIEAATIKFCVPKIPWISNLTGVPVSSSEPVTAVYWRRHLREPVVFANCVATAVSVSPCSFLELGAEPQLSAIVEANGVSRDQILASVSKHGSEGEFKKVLNAAGVLYTRGINFQWKDVNGSGSFRRVALPGYPFERKRFWFNAAALNPSAQAEASFRNACAAAFEQAEMVPVQLDPARIAMRQELVNCWATALIFETLKDLGCFNDPSEPLSSLAIIRDFAVAPVHGRLMDRWLARLQAAGILESVADQPLSTHQLVPGPSLRDPQSIWAEAEPLLVADPPLRNYLSNCCAVLKRILKGQLDPIESLFPGGNGDLASALYSQSPAAAYVNQIAAAALASRGREAIQTAMSFPRKLRVLEIGAGTGSTTAAVLPRLSSSRLLYTFSDVSDLFLSRAKLRFTDPCMEFILFDLDDQASTAAHQGRYDVVLIANALHASKNLRVSLNRVRQVLQPGGLLILIETTAAQAWHDISTGLIEGWQHFDDEARSATPLLSVDRWQQELSIAGFNHSSFVPGPGMPTNALGLHVLLATRPIEDREMSARLDQLPLESNHNELTSNSTQLTKASSSCNAAGSAASQTQNFLTLDSDNLRKQLENASTKYRANLILNCVKTSVSAVLGRPELPRNEDRLMDIGLDSLMAVELRNRLQVLLSVCDLPSTLIFDYPTPESIAEMLLVTLGYETAVGKILNQPLPQPVFRETADKSIVVTDDELDQMSNDEIANLLRLQLDS